MEKRAFYKREAALAYANELAEEVKGYVSQREVTVGTSAFDSPEELDSWSGEISAFEVYDENYECAAYIGYWE